jgi:hypothetical protein
MVLAHGVSVQSVMMKTVVGTQRLKEEQAAPETTSSPGSQEAFVHERWPAGACLCRLPRMPSWHYLPQSPNFVFSNVMMQMHKRCALAGQCTA